MAVGPGPGGPSPVQPVITPPGGRDTSPGMSPAGGEDGRGGAPGGGGGGGPNVVHPTITPAGAGGGKGSISANSAMLIMVRRRPKWRPYLSLVNALADEYNIDKVFLLSALIAADPNARNPGKINNFAKRYAEALRNSGSPYDAYQAVNPRGDRQPFIPPRYVSGRLPTSADIRGAEDTPGGGRAPKLTPEEQVQLSIYKSLYKKSLTDPWVVIKNGKLRFSSSLNAPKGSLGIRRSDFMSEWEKKNEIFEAYLGRKAKAGEVAMVIKKGWSDYTLVNNLSKRPAFVGSRIWKSVAPEYQSIGMDMLGDAWATIPQKERNELVRKAIVNDWSATTFAEQLRRRPEYLKGTEFQTNVANLRSVYESIYGIGGDDTRIQEAALARWTPDQFAQHLRKLPGYTSSPEYQGRALAVLDALGMITGQFAALQPGAPIPNPAGQGQKIPDSPRIPGTAGPVAPTTPGAGLRPGLVSV